MVWQSDLKSTGRKNSVYIKKHTILQEDTCDLNEVEGSLLRFCLGLGVVRKQKRSWTGLGLLCLEALFLYFTKTIGWNVDLDLDDYSGETSGWESTVGGGLLLPLFFSISVFSFFLFVFFFLSEWGMFFLFFHSDWGSDGDWVLWGLDFGFGGVVWDAWLDCGFGQGGYWIGMIRNLGFWRIVWVRSGSDSEIRFVLDLGFDDVGKGGGVWGCWRIGFDWDKELTGRPRQGFYFLFFAG